MGSVDEQGQVMGRRLAVLENTSSMHALPAHSNRILCFSASELIKKTGLLLGLTTQNPAPSLGCLGWAWAARLPWATTRGMPQPLFQSPSVKGPPLLLPLSPTHSQLSPRPIKVYESPAQGPAAPPTGECPREGSVTISLTVSATGSACDCGDSSPWGWSCLHSLPHTQRPPDSELLPNPLPPHPFP